MHELVDVVTDHVDARYKHEDCFSYEMFYRFTSVCAVTSADVFCCSLNSCFLLLLLLLLLIGSLSRTKCKTVSSNTGRYYAKLIAIPLVADITVC